MPTRSPSEFAGAPWLAADPAGLAATAGVPTMLAHDEQRFYHWLTAHWARGRGAVVDLGCFLGGSTARLAEGARAAGHGAPIHAYDRFRASANLPAKLGLPPGLPAIEAGDALPLARALLAPWQDLVTLHKGEIERAGPWADGPIELLVMDASKTAAHADAQADMFFPALIPGESLVVQQDYLHWRQPWLPAQMQLLAAHVVPVAHARADTMAFLCTRAITPEALAGARVSELSDQALLNILRAARETYRAFGVQARLKPAIEAVKASPGVRAAYRMRQGPARG